MLAPIYGIGDSCLSLVCTFLEWSDHFKMMLVDKKSNKVSSSPQSWDIIERKYCSFSRNKNVAFGFAMNPKSLELSDINITDEKIIKRITSSSNTKNIKRLVINNIFTHKHTKLSSFLEHLPTLEHLSISNCDVNKNTFVGLNSLRYLKYLKLGIVEGDSLPSCLRLHPNVKKTLEYMFLEGNCYPSTLLSDLQGSSCINEIFLLSVVGLTNECASSIRSMTSLVEIGLDNCHDFSDWFLEEISRSASLRIIWLDNCDVNIKVMSRIMKVDGQLGVWQKE
jgi:hypothetical protein